MKHVIWLQEKIEVSGENHHMHEENMHKHFIYFSKYTIRTNVFLENSGGTPQPRQASGHIHDSQKKSEVAFVFVLLAVFSALHP